MTALLLVGGKLRLAAEFDAVGFGVGPAARGALQNVAAFELRCHAKDRKNDLGKIGRGIEKRFGQKLHDALDTAKYPKKESYRRVDELKNEVLATIPEEDEELQKEALRAFERLREKYFRDDVLNRHRRPDGRAFDQIRPISCEVGLLPRVHGSALFTRGETQALATLTLGTKEDMQRLDLLFEDERRLFEPISVLAGGCDLDTAVGVAPMTSC